MLLVFKLVNLLTFFKRKKRLLPKLIWNLSHLIFFNLSLWYILSCFLSILVANVQESKICFINHEDSVPRIIIFLIGTLITLILTLSFIYFILLPFKSKYKSNLRFSTFIQGLNIKSQLKVIIYYSNFFGIWFIVTVLIALSSDLNSKILWGLVVGF